MKKLPPKNNPDLSIIILNYNSQDYLAKCLKSISKSELGKYTIETVVADNASTDNSLELAKNITTKNPTAFLNLGKNFGFAKGNNLGLAKISPHPKYVLFLNPDTIVKSDTFKKMIEFFIKNPTVDAATANLILVSKNMTQPECHRGFPTPINAFWHFFGCGLPSLFSHTKSLNGYLLNYLDYSKVQQIDACSGAFLMVKKSVGDTIGWWNEKYFFYGEDLDFGFQLKKHGFKLFFYPNAVVFHYQGISSGLKSHTQKISTNSRQNKIKVARASTEAMRIFYRENLIQNYYKPLQWLVWQGINMLETYRLFKAKFL